MERKNKASDYFVYVLALVSILGFVAIISETLFSTDIRVFIESLWLIIVGVGMLAEGKIMRLGRIREEGLTPVNFTHLITVIVGAIAVVAGFLNFGGVTHASFQAVKGIIAIIAIIIIVIQTWIVE